MADFQLNRKELFDKLKKLDTEQRNPDSMHIDVASPLEIVQIINEQDKQVAGVVESKKEYIASAIELVAEAIKKGGRLIYAGSGTSGRIGVVDAAECPPTFGTDPEQVQGLIAGGAEAMFRAQEGAEDSEDTGATVISGINLNEKDVLCALAASGRTPFVAGALAEANKRNAKTIFICCVPASQIDKKLNCDILIDLPVGAEVIMGSTRMKSATAQKMVCNMITTGAMIRLGKVYENVMVDLQLTNLKLVERAKRIVMMFTGLEYDEAEQLLEKAGNHVKTALIMAKTGLNTQESKKLLEEHGGFVSSVLEHVN